MQDRWGKAAVTTMYIPWPTRCSLVVGGGRTVAGFNGISLGEHLSR